MNELELAIALIVVFIAAWRGLYVFFKKHLNGPNLYEKR